MALTLVIGNKNYSSWSFRPWIAMKVAGIAFDEVVISLDARRFQAARVENLRHRQGAGAGRQRHPCLGVAGDPGISRRAVSGRETLAGRSGGAGACARDLVGNARRLRAAAPRLPDEHVASGQEARAERGGAAPTSAASRRCGPNAAPATARAGRSCSARSAPPTRCMRRWWRAFTPTMSRSSAAARAYMDAVMALPAWAEWKAAALQGAWVLAEDEVDWPVVRKRRFGAEAASRPRSGTSSGRSRSA